MHNRPFDLNRIDYKAVLKNKRRKLLLWSIPPVAIVFLLALWFILPSILNSQAIGDYKKGDYKPARNWLTPLTWSSPEPFVAAFNSGTTDSRLGKYDLAEKELTRALALAPAGKRCMVVQNLVSTLETHAENLTTKGKPKEASISNKRAIGYKLYNQSCFEWQLTGTVKADKPRIKIGEAVTFTYQVANSGPGVAIDVSWNGNWFMADKDRTGEVVPDNGVPPGVTVTSGELHTGSVINSNSPVGENSTYNPTSPGYICGYTAYSPNVKGGTGHPRSAILCVQVVSDAGGGGGGGGGSSSDTNTLSASQQQQLAQKEQEGRERQEQYASKEEYDPNDPRIRPW